MKLSTLVRKELGRIRADKRSLILLFSIPIILIVIFGLTTGGSVTKFFNASIISIDEMPTYDNYPSNTSEYEDDFASVFLNGLGSFGFQGYYPCSSGALFLYAYEKNMELLRNEEIDVFLVLPEDFSERIENQTTSYIAYFVDGSDSQATSAIQVAMQEPIASFRQEIEMTQNLTAVIPYLEFEVPFWEKQTLNYAFPLTIPLIIIGTTMNLACLSIVSDEPLPRMLITPTSKGSIILSKLIANALIMVLQAGEIFIGTALFGLYSLGSLYALLLVLLGVGLSGVSIGLFISSLSGTEQQANQLYMILFVVILLFSGVYINPEGLPTIMRLIVYLFPLAHAIPLIYDITLKGLPLDLMAFFGLLILCSVYLILSYIIFLFKKVEV
jgi:ABC-2 type transport system permease protein